jgi:excisionase family DNA binding protein
VSAADRCRTTRRLANQRLIAPDRQCRRTGPTRLGVVALSAWPISKQPKQRARNRVTRLAYTPGEAAAAIGVGRTTFYEQVLPDLRVIRIGRKRLIPIRELEKWTERRAARTLD